MELTDTFKRVKEASKTLATISDEKRNDILLAVADGIENNIPQLIADNALDLARMDKDRYGDKTQIDNTSSDGSMSPNLKIEFINASNTGIGQV